MAATLGYYLDMIISNGNYCTAVDIIDIVQHGLLLITVFLLLKLC